ncbi:MAG: winged helix-turn-helix domain-containing protein, partial [Oligoflexia bacterium]|nr:winged helix-turn-helix domain-containing protein [Oligoflexia bacterium]
MFHRVQTLLLVALGIRYDDISNQMAISLDSIRCLVNSFLAEVFSSLTVGKSTGRKPKLTKTQKNLLKEMIKKGSEANGFCSGCWNSAMIQELIRIKFSVFYSAKYIVNLLNNFGLSYQKAKFESCNLDPKNREEWLNKTFPKLFALAKRKKSLLLFGDECSFPMWGSLSYTWAEKGIQPVIKTSGNRRACKVFG